MDEFVDALLTEERVCDIILPRLTKREVLEETEGLPERVSSLLDAMEGSGSEDEEGNKKPRRVVQPRRPLVNDSGDDREDEGEMEEGEMDGSVGRGRSKSKSRSRSRSGSAGGSPEPEGERYISRSPSESKSRSASPYRSKSRSISPDRMEGVDGPGNADAP
jgi:pre-mRNA-splicing factor 38A